MHAGIPPPPWNRHPLEQTPPSPGADTPPQADPPRADNPPGADPPGEQTPLGSRPPGADTPRNRHPPGTDTTPAADTPHRSRHPPGSRHPPREADSSIRSTSGRYASYWNAFLCDLSVADPGFLRRRRQRQSRNAKLLRGAFYPEIYMKKVRLEVFLVPSVNSPLIMRNTKCQEKCPSPTERIASRQQV